MKEKLFLWCAIGLLLNGCANFDKKTAQVTTPSVTNTSTAHLETTLIPSAPAAPTITFVTPSPDLQPTPTVQITSTTTPWMPKGSVPPCAGRGQIHQPDEPFGIKGTIIFHKLDMFQGLYTLGGFPLRQSQLPVDQTQKYQVLGFSPDGKWLAYSPIPEDAFEPVFERDFVWSSRDIILVSDSGEQHQIQLDIQFFSDELPPGAVISGGDSFYWINDHLMYVDLEAITPYKNEYTSYNIHRPKVFDVFSGAWQLDWVNHLPDKNFSLVSFSSDLTRALYFVPPQQVVLADMQSGKILWEEQGSRIDLIESVGWSPDNQMVVLLRTLIPANLTQISILSREGEMMRTIATDRYPAPPDFSPIKAVWSPNGHYIAIPTYDREVFIYDVAKNAYLFRCPVNSPDYLKWSPDSQYIAMGNERSPLLILDIQTGNIVEAVAYGIPVGWSGTFPVE